MTVISAALLLFLVLDPFGNIPFFLAALKQVEPARQTWVMIRELLIALLALILFLFLGQYLLRLLNISEPALTVAGGIILFLIALKMIFPPQAGGQAEELQGEPFVVPLAIPYVAGPSAFASVMFIMNREPQRWPEWLTALGIAWVLTSAILFLASQLRRFLGRRGLIATERLMGMVLVTIAVQMLMSGFRQFWTQP
ncbi:MAG TPA: MarC family protein [Acidobacteriota bacterium]